MPRIRSSGAMVLVLALACGCKGDRPLRSADPSRPPLDDRRITRLVALADSLRPGNPELAAYLDDGDIAIGMDLDSLRMVPAENMVGADGIAALRASGEEPKVFVRDVFWMRLVSSAVRTGRTVDEKIGEIRSTRAKVAFLSPLLDAEARAMVPAMDALVVLHSRIGRDEEAAVRARETDIRRVTFRFPARAKVRGDSLRPAP